MGPESVDVLVGGTRFTSFREVRVTAALDHAARAFDLVVAAEAGSAATAWLLAPGTAIDIMANGDLLLRGYVDRYQPKMNRGAGREVKVAGRSKAQDFIDSAAVDPNGTGRFENMTIASIAAALDQFDVGVISDQQLDPVEDYQITPGETAFGAIEKICRSEGLTLSGTAEGGINITRAGSVRHAGGLVEGVNIVDGSADLNWSGRHSKVTVIGQKPAGHGDSALRITASSSDDAIGRNRPHVMVADDDTDDDNAQATADYRLAREAGESLRASIEVQGFRDDAGRLWTPGYTVWTESPFLGVTQVMLIREVAFDYSRQGGATAFIGLVDPQAFGGKTGKGGSSKDPWTTRPSKIRPGR